MPCVNARKRAFPRSNMKFRTGPRQRRLRPAARQQWYRSRIDPRRIRFSQAKCSPQFRDGTPILALLCELWLDPSKVHRVPPIRVVWNSRYWTSLDNRRLALFKILRIFGRLHDIPVSALNTTPAINRRVLRECGKTSTRDFGRTIRVRGEHVTVGSTIWQCHWS